MNIPTTLFLACLLSSFVEYSLHRFYLHYFNKESHVQNHHRQFDGKKSFEIPDAKQQDIMPGYKYILASAALYYVPSALLFIEDTLLGLLFFVAALSYTLWAEYIHLHFHKPDGKNIEKLRIFNVLKKNHLNHHINNKAHYGVGSNVWDILLNTEH